VAESIELFTQFRWQFVTAGGVRHDHILSTSAVVGTLHAEADYR